uniref:hypothetical protein n=1 Tax=Halomonas sp. TaxID=1486246 RepID=UPI00260ED8F7|nr:hypothetical protein [Halomonas sp.]
MTTTASVMVRKTRPDFASMLFMSRLALPSSQRGTNEPSNDLLRQCIPKETDFRQITDAELRALVKKLNDQKMVWLSDISTGIPVECTGAARIG